jgi:meso-butanediol dehydrogenase/(S,S)-butanediol dehydrogenase/diacetyl reductase
LGEGIVRRLAQDGWSVLMSDISPTVRETAQKIIAGTGISAARLIAGEHDVANAERTAELVDAAVDRFGDLDLAVANAGTGGVEVDLVNLAVEDFEHIVDVNYRGVSLTCKYAGRVMREQGSGSSSITVSSIFGQEPYPRVAIYSGSKAGVIALTLAFALEMAPHNVRVNTIAPGYMATEMQWAGLRQRAASYAFRRREPCVESWNALLIG